MACGKEFAKTESTSQWEKSGSDMANIKAFKIAGVVCWFWPNDHDLHFHAEKSGEWEVKVNFLAATEDMIELVWKKKKQIPRKSLKLLCDYAEEYREQLLIEWEEAVNHDV
jgi:hypothetical protein